MCLFQGHVPSISQTSVADGSRHGCLIANCCVFGAAAGFDFLACPVNDTETGSWLCRGDVASAPWKVKQDGPCQQLLARCAMHSVKYSA